MDFLMCIVAALIAIHFGNLYKAHTLVCNMVNSEKGFILHFSVCHSGCESKIVRYRNILVGCVTYQINNNSTSKILLV